MGGKLKEIGHILQHDAIDKWYHQGLFSGVCYQHYQHMFVKLCNTGFYSEEVLVRKYRFPTYTCLVKRQFAPCFDTLNQTSLKMFIPKCPIDNKWALAQVMAWCQRGDDPLPSLMMAMFFNAIYHHKAPMSELNANLLSNQGGGAT